MAGFPCTPLRETTYYKKDHKAIKNNDNGIYDVCENTFVPKFYEFGQIQLFESGTLKKDRDKKTV